MTPDERKVRERVAALLLLAGGCRPRLIRFDVIEALVAKGLVDRDGALTETGKKAAEDLRQRRIAAAVDRRDSGR